MQIIINGQPKSFDGSPSIATLLAEEKLEGMKIAVARNGTFVPKGDYAHIALEDGDDIEIVAPMQGG